jgi:hypothetical protein
VEDVSLEYFAHGRAIRVRHDRPRFDRHEVVARARSRLGERSYRILTNNCEHFCEWCLNGASRSTQVERWLSGARRFACALLGTVGLAVGTPTFADPASHSLDLALVKTEDRREQRSAPIRRRPLRPRRPLPATDPGASGRSTAPVRLDTPVAIHAGGRK